MATRSSLDLLSDILTELDYLIQLQVNKGQNDISDNVTTSSEAKNSTVNVEINGGDDVATLMAGLLRMLDSKGNVADVGKQVESLSKGILSFSKLDPNLIESTAELITKLANIINDIDVKSDATDSIKSVSNFLEATSLINDKNIKSLVLMGSKLTTDMAANIVGFLNALILTNPQATMASALAIRNIFSSFASIVAIDISKFKDVAKKLDPSIAKKIGKFISELIKELLVDPVTNLKGLGDFVSGLNAILTILLTGSIVSMNPIKAHFLGRKLANFVKTIVKSFTSLVDKPLKEMGDTLLALTNLLNAVVNINYRHLVLLMLSFKLIPKSSFQDLRTFLSILKEDIPSDAQAWKEGAEAFTLVVTALNTLTMGTVLKWVLLSKLVNKESGTLIKDFFTEIFNITDEIDEDKVESMTKFIKSITSGVLLITVAIGLMVGIVALAKPMLIIAAIGIITAVVVGMTYLTIFLSKKAGNDELKAGLDALKDITHAVLLTTVAIGLMVGIVALAKPMLIIAAIGIVTIVTLGMVGVMYILSNMEKESMNIAITGLKQITTGLLLTVAAISILALVTKFIGMKETLIATGIVTVTVLSLTLALKILGNKEDQEAISSGSKALMVLTGCVVIVGATIAFLAYLVKTFSWETIVTGTLIVAGMITLMTGIVWFIDNKINKDKLASTLSILGAMVIMLGVVSLITKLIIIPIGLQAKEALFGALITVGLIVAMGSIVWAVTYIEKKVGGWKKILLAEGIVISIGLVLMALGKVLPPYIELSKKVGSDPITIAIGGAELIAILTVWGSLMMLLGKFMTGTLAEYLIAGEATVASIGVVLWAIGKLMPAYIALTKDIGLNKEDIALGSLELAGIITGWGAWMAAVGALLVGSAGTVAIAMAAGAATVEAVAAVLWSLGEMMPSYINLCKKIADVGNAPIDSTKKLAKIIGGWGLLLTALGGLTLLMGGGLLTGTGVVAAKKIGDVLKELSISLNPFVDLTVKMKKNNIDSKTVKAFRDLMITGDNSLIRSMTKIIKELSNVSLKNAKKASLIMKDFKPIFDSIGLFLNIIKLFSSMKYVDEWDENGKPKHYLTITPDMLRRSGLAISESFGIFLMYLGKGLDSISLKSIAAMNMLKTGIKPVMESVSIFVLTIISALSNKIPTEWDENGNPTNYRTVTTSEFKQASEIISTNFATFIDILTTDLSTLKDNSTNVIALLKDGIEPVMNAVKTYTDAIMNVTNGVIEVTDPATGEMIKKQVDLDVTKFTEIANTIGNCFTTFITTLLNALSQYDYEDGTKFEYMWGLINYKSGDVKRGNKAAELMSGLSAIGDIIAASESLVNLIVKLTNDVKGIDTSKKAADLGNMFTSFINALATGIDNTNNRVDNVLNNLKKAKSVITEFDSVLKTLKAMNTEDNLNSVNAMKDILTDFVSIKNIDGLNSSLNNTISAVNNIIKNVSDTLLNGYNNINKIYLNYIKRLDELNKLADKEYKLIKTNIYSTEKAIHSLINAFNSLHNILKTQENERTQMLLKIQKLFKGISDEINRAANALKDYELSLSAANNIKIKAAKLPVPVVAVDTEGKPIHSNKPLTDRTNDVMSATGTVVNKTSKAASNLLTSSDKNNSKAQIANIENWEAVGNIIALQVGTALQTIVTKKWNINVTIDRQVGSNFLQGTSMFS